MTAMKPVEKMMTAGTITTNMKTVLNAVKLESMTTKLLTCMENANNNGLT